MQAKNWHHAQLGNLSHKKDIPGSGSHRAQHPEEWELLCDKGYQGALYFLRVISPKNNPSGSVLSNIESAENTRISSDSEIIEEFLADCARCGE